MKVKFMANGNSDLPKLRIGPIIVSVLVVIGFISVLGLILFHPVNVTGEIADVFKILVGALSAKFGDVVQYNIGSSAGSKNKDDIINDHLSSLRETNQILSSGPQQAILTPTTTTTPEPLPIVIEKTTNG